MEKEPEMVGALASSTELPFLRILAEPHSRVEGGSDSKRLVDALRDLGVGRARSLQRAVVGVGGRLHSFRGDQEVPRFEQDAQDSTAGRILRQKA